MGALIFWGYVAVWLIYGWRLTVHLLDAEVRDWQKQFRGTASEYAKELRGLYLVAGFGLAVIWPVVAPVRGAYRLVSAGGLFRTPAEREESDRAELERLRALAREHNLPMPEVRS